MLIADPQDVTVEANQWAKFNCTVHYEYSKTVNWYMAGYSGVIKRNNTVPGLLIKRRPSTCTESGERTYFFEVYATEAFNKSAFYCAAYEQERSCSCGTDGRCYSRPALLTGEPVRKSALKVGNFCLLFVSFFKVLCPFLLIMQYYEIMLFVYYAILVKMAATVIPPAQASVTQTSTPSNCSTSGTLIIQ